MSYKILIIGGGFIGRTAAEYFSKLGWRVTVLTNNCFDLNFYGHVIKCDVSNINELRESIEDEIFEYVLICFGRIDHSKEVTNALKNSVYDKYIGIVNILKVKNFYASKKIINLGSSLELTDAKHSYVSVNRECTAFLEAASNEGLVNVINLQLSQIYGVHQSNGRLISDLIIAIKTNQIINIKNLGAKRDYLYIEDLLDGLKKVFLSDIKKGTYQIGGGKTYSVQNIIDLIQKISKKNFKIIEGKKSLNIDVIMISNARFKKDFNWLPNTDIETGLRKIIKFNSLVDEKLPASNALIRLSKPFIGSKEKLAASRVLDSHYLGMGGCVQKFESLLTEYIGRKVVCVSSGTAALHLALQGCKIGFGDEVLVPSFTYLATFQAITATGAKPIPCDLDKDSLAINLQDLESKITSKTRAIMPVHYVGYCANIDSVYEIAKKYQLRVIEDAAHSFGSDWNGQKIGFYGDITCFSFDAIKNITSIEGGCVVTGDQAVMENVASSRLLGLIGDDKRRYENKRVYVGGLSGQGWRYHMGNLNAAIGIEQLKQINFFAERRRYLAKKYDEAFKSTIGIEILQNDYSQIIPHIYMILVNGKKEKSEIITICADLGVEIGSGYYPNHLHTQYAVEGFLYPNTDKFYERAITLPLHVGLSGKEQDYVINTIRKLIGKT